MAGKAINLIGMKFGRLLVVARNGSRWNMAIWRCDCDCGSSADVAGADLRRGHTMSCGCLTKEIKAAECRDRKKHGEAVVGQLTPEYKTWLGMIRRCENPNEANFKNYGGRGISVCFSWRENYEKFLADMGRRPSGGYSIDRINNDGNYEPGNCRWATRAEQNSNTRRSKNK